MCSPAVLFATKFLLQASPYGPLRRANLSGTLGLYLLRDPGATVTLALLAGRLILLRLKVHVGSFFGVWVLQVSVLVVVVSCFEYTVLLALVLVVHDVV